MLVQLRSIGLLRAFVMASIASVQMLASDLVSGRTERSIGTMETKAISSIAYMYYETRPDMPRYQRVVNEFVSNSVGTLWQDQPDRTTSVLSHGWFTRVLADVDSVYQESVKTFPESPPWTLIDSVVITDRVTIQDRATDLAQVFKHQYTFTGGAHGISSTLCMLFHRKTGEIVLFKDLIGPAIKKVTSIVEKHFRKQRNIPARQSLKNAGYWFDKGFYIADNARFDGTDIVVIYNPYEIASYVFGTITIRIPFADVSSLMRIPFFTMNGRH